MSAPDFTSSRWRKSSRSNGAQVCIEVAWSQDTTVTGVRDSKQPGGPTLTLSRNTWMSFIGSVKVTSDYTSLG